MITRPAAARLFSLLTGLCLLSACVSVLPQPKPAAALYRIAPSADKYSVSARIVINEPDAPRLLAGRAIASVRSDGTLRLIPRVAWADTATRLLQVALLDSLEPADGQSQAAVLASATGLQGDYQLSWRIVDFVVDDLTARCDLELTLLDGSSRAVIVQHAISTRNVAASNGSQARASALSVAGRDCVREAAAYVAAAASPSSVSQ